MVTIGSKSIPGLIEKCRLMVVFGKLIYSYMNVFESFIADWKDTYDSRYSDREAQCSAQLR